MKKAILSFVTIALLLVTLPSAASEIDAATVALSEHLKKERSGAVSQQAKCPKKGDVQYITDFKFKPIPSGAIVGSLGTMACPIGNSTNQFLVLIENGKGRVIASDAVGAMNFMGDEFWVEGDILKIDGVKWVADDAHCCPSKKGTLEYNLKTGKHTYTLHKINGNN